MSGSRLGPGRAVLGGGRRAAGAMGQLCCFPFSRGEEKIGECGGSALPCASAGCAAAPGSLQLRKAGWRARGAFLGGLLVLLS